MCGSLVRPYWMSTSFLRSPMATGPATPPLIWKSPLAEHTLPIGEITAAVVDRYRSAGRMDKGRILDELCAVTGWHRKHAVRALASRVGISPEARRQRGPTYGATIRDALVALWEASDRICGKRLKVMIPTLLPSLERHGRLKLDELITGRCTLDGINDGFEALRRGRSIRTVVEF